MIRSGIEIRCERCGTHAFYMNDGPVSPSTAMDSDGWDVRLGKDLCCECVENFDAMVEKFMNEIIFK